MWNPIDSVHPIWIFGTAILLGVTIRQFFRRRIGPVRSGGSDIRRLVEGVEAEINNGGFHQYFFNSAADDVVKAITALEAIGAHITAELVRSACAKFPGGIPPSDRKERQRLLERIDPEINNFKREDDQFLLYEEDLSALVDRYESRA